jgi:hypothetical protein
MLTVVFTRPLRLADDLDRVDPLRERRQDEPSLEPPTLSARRQCTPKWIDGAEELSQTASSRQPRLAVGLHRLLQCPVGWERSSVLTFRYDVRCDPLGGKLVPLGGLDPVPNRIECWQEDEDEHSSDGRAPHQHVSH